MDGRKIKENILNNLKIEIDKLKLKPSLTVIQVGNDEASNIYVKQKKKGSIKCNRLTLMN